MASTLHLPVSPYVVGGYTFGQRVRSRIILWARHLGDDVIVPPGTPIQAAGDGQVVWAEVRPGSLEKRNWGGIVIVSHTHKTTGQTFYTLYGHMNHLRVKIGDTVTAGQQVGEVAAGRTAENGWWKTPHLHFGVYLGPWTDAVLPGYKRFFDDRTRFHWWRNPQVFIKEYNQG